VNIQRDGISVNNQRWPNGLETPTKMNPDLVGEIRMILAPVDAEMGRGNGQIQIQTRSGTNQYRGSIFWTNRNSALSANAWGNNFRGVGKDYKNGNQFGGRVGGPIVKNKTFFFFSYEGVRRVADASTIGAGAGVLGGPASTTRSVYRKG
jgi:hypothetical protein